MDNCTNESDNEFFDAPEESVTHIEDFNESKDINHKGTNANVIHELVNSNIQKTETNTKPLHERLNENLNLKDASIESDDEAKEQEKNDPCYIDEDKLKNEQENLTVEDLNKMLADALTVKEIGNKFFKEGDYQSAVQKYTEALRICPIIDIKSRSILYSNRSTSFLKMLDNEKCIIDCTKAIDLDPTFVKPLLRRAECYENTDKLDEALVDYKKLCELEPKNSSYKSKCYALEQKINDRNEKLKTEMMGKLKELGNMVLKPFGLSTNNFQFVKDENTGSYSVNFKQ